MYESTFGLCFYTPDVIRRFWWTWRQTGNADLTPLLSTPLRFLRIDSATHSILVKYFNHEVMTATSASFRVLFRSNISPQWSFNKNLRELHLIWRHLYGQCNDHFLFSVSPWQNSCQESCRYPAGAMTTVRSGEISLLGLLIPGFSGCVIRKLSVCAHVSIENVTLCISLLNLPSGFKTAEGAVKDKVFARTGNRTRDLVSKAHHAEQSCDPKWILWKSNTQQKKCWSVLPERTAVAAISVSPVSIPV